MAVILRYGISCTLACEMHLPELVAAGSVLFVGAQPLVSLRRLAVLFVNRLDKLHVVVAVSPSTLRNIARAGRGVQKTAHFASDDIECHLSTTPGVYVHSGIRIQVRSRLDG